MNFQQKFCKRKIPAIECANIVRDPLSAFRLLLSACRLPLAAFTRDALRTKNSPNRKR